MAAATTVTDFEIQGVRELEAAIKKAEKDVDKYASTSMKGFGRVSESALAAAEAMSRLGDNLEEVIAKSLPKSTVANWDKLADAVDRTEKETKKLTTSWEHLKKSMSRSKSLFGLTGYGQKLAAMKGVVDNLVSSYTKLSGAMKVGVVGAFTAITVGGVAAISTMNFFRKELMKGWELSKRYQKSFAILKQTFEGSEKAGNMGLKDTTDQMEKLFKKTLFAKDAILDVQATLARTTKNAIVLSKATKLALDVAAAKDSMSPESAAQWITTILGDPGRAVDKLRRAEIQVSLSFQKMLTRLVESGRMQEAQMLVLSQISMRFSGAAEAAAGTVAGKQQMFAKQWMEVMRQGADIFIDEFAPVFESLMVLLETNKDSLLNSFKGAAVVAASIVKIVTPMIETALDLANWAERNTPRPTSMDRGTSPGMQSEAAKDSWARNVAWALLSGNPKANKYKTTSEKLLGGKERKTMRPVSEREREQLRRGELTSSVRGWLIGNEAALKSAEAERKEKEIAEQYSRRAMSAEERLLAFQERQKVIERQRLGLQAEFERSLKRVQVYQRDTSTHWETFGAQARKLYDVREKAVKSGNYTTELQDYLSEIYRRLYKVAYDTQAEIDNAPAVAAKKEQDKLNALADKYKRKDPVTALMQDFEKLKKLTDPRERLAAFSIINDELAKVGKKKDEGGFSSVSTGIEQLNSSIRNSALTRSNNSTKDAIERQAALDRANATAGSLRVTAAIHATRTSVAGGP